VDPSQLLSNLADMLWPAGDELLSAAGNLAALTPLADVGPELQDRLLTELPSPPSGGPVASLVGEVLGDLRAGELRWHGWQTASADRGVALVLTQGSSRAVLALEPGPQLQIVVPAASSLRYRKPASLPWEVQCDVTTTETWQASLGRGLPAAAATGSASLKAVRRTRVQVGDPPGPGASWSELSLRLDVTPSSPATAEVVLRDFTASVIPEALTNLPGMQQLQSGADHLTVAVDRAGGVRFSTGPRFPLPLPRPVPGVALRGLGVELLDNDGGVRLRATVSAVAELAALPLRLDLEHLGVDIPLVMRAGAFSVGTPQPQLPKGIGARIALPPASGGGTLTERPSNEYVGVLDVDLGAVRVQAIGRLVLPGPDRDLSFLVLLSAVFPPPGVQLSFGFALDAVGGLLGVNSRVDAEALRQLVSDGNADQVMFPDNALARAHQIVDSLSRSFPVARGRHLVGPMVRLNWGGRMVRLSLAVVVEVPDPVRLTLLGRLLIGVPDPELPVVRLQASVLGRIDPAVPMVEVLVSLAGSWIAGVPITGELYLLFRGGRDATFVLSAGGFHPRYVRPSGVPALRRVSMDLSGGILGLRGEGYLAVTSNSLQFGAAIHLDATIAECGVEGHLGLDALFVWEPRIAFVVRVGAHVAVLALGERLASVALDFTLEGPGAWHAYGSGSISVLWWDVDLDFDVRWGDPAPLTAGGDNVVEAVRDACALPGAWAVAPPPARRTPLQLTDEAARSLTDGDLALPDSALRFSQTAVPLARRFDRFHRSSVAPQRWEFRAAQLGTGVAATKGDDVTSGFVPGEYLTMTEQEQLTAPAFADWQSGVELAPSHAGVAPGSEPPHRVADETYETSYEVDENWFTQPAETERFFATMLVAFALEGFSRTLLPAERLDRWRFEQALHVGTDPLVALR